MTGNTIKLHRILMCPPEKVYKAFTDADSLARWLPPHGFTSKVHKLDARVGGTHQATFTNFSTGQSHSFGGTFLELVPGKLIKYTDHFDDPNLAGEVIVTVHLKAVSCGTELTIEQSNLPKVIPLDACYLGWQQSLGYLANLVEPNIPD